MAATGSTGLNAAYVAQLREDYLDSPASVPDEWRRIFEADVNGSPEPMLAPAAAPWRPRVTAPPQCPPRPRLSPPPLRPQRLPRRPSRRGRPGALGRRRGRDGARQGVPHARASRGAARPAGLRAPGRPCARREPSPSAAHPGAAGADPRTAAPALRARRDPPRGAPAVARGLHGLQRVRDRAHLGPRGARVAAQGDRVRTLRRPARSGGAPRVAAAPDGGGGLRALPAPLVPRTEAVLARGARRARADARRVDRARRRRWRARGRDRDGAPRAG